MYLYFQVLVRIVQWTTELFVHAAASSDKMFPIIKSITFNQVLNEVQKLEVGLSCNERVSGLIGSLHIIARLWLDRS